MTVARLSERRRLLSTTAGLLAGGLAFFLTLLDYSTDLTRTATKAGYFSNFFDLQGRAFLDGRISLPPGSLSIEGFIHDGKTFTYFPPWPALLRLPVLFTTREYDGHLTLISMALAWIVLAVMTVKLVWLLVARLTGSQDVSRSTAVLVAIFLAAATGGTVLTFDASLPWVYHEVYTWAAAAAVGCLYWMVRVAIAPDGHTIRWLFLFALIAVGSRATEGLAIALVVLVVALLLLVRPRIPEHRRWWWKVLLAGAVPVAASVALNLYKFDHVFLFPLQDQVWTQVNAHRREALAANGGTITGPQFFTTSFMAYLRPDGIRFVDYFPWITLPARPAPAYSGAFVDQSYRTGSVTSFMPLLLVLLAATLVATFRPRAPAALQVLRAPLVASILITGGVMGYGYYSTRYTSDFLPALVLGGAAGTALLCVLVERRPRLAVPVSALLGVATAFSVAAYLATGYFTASVTARGADLEGYVAQQHRFSPGAQARLVTQLAGYPSGGSTDDLVIRGACEGLYLNTGDRYDTWVPVQERDRSITVERSSVRRSGQATLLSVAGRESQSVDLQVNDVGRARFVVRTDTLSSTGPWVDLEAGESLELAMRTLPDIGFYEFSTPGTFSSPAPQVVGNLPSSYFDKDWYAQPGVVTFDPDPQALSALGLSMTDSLGLAPRLCTELAARAGIDVSAAG